MKYRKYRKSDFNNWLSMALALWPDYSKTDLAKELRAIAKSKRQTTFIAIDGSKYIGFINISLRHEHVEGSKSSPVGYSEGIYIKPPYRKQGVASQLLKMGEIWATGKGAKEMASDTWLWNKDSRTFHKKLGFKETEKIVHFIKKSANK